MKILAISLLLALSCLAALGQGQVQFRTYYQGTTPAIDARVCLGGVPLSGTNTLWRAALLGGPTTSTPASVGQGIRGNLSMMYNPTTTTLTWVNFGTGTNAGYVNTGGQRARAVPGVDWGGTALVQMVVWQGNYDTWNDAFSAMEMGTPGVLLGCSNPLTLTLPSGPTSTSLTYLWGLQSFNLLCLNCPYFTGFTGPNSVTANVGDPVAFTVWADAWPSPYYDWYLNGTLVQHGYQNVYQIPSVRPSNAGRYYVVMSHPMGTFTSGTATLTVLIPVPLITFQPQSQTAVAGSGTVFRVSATGDAPLGYQWYFNGSQPVGTGTALKLTDLQPRDAGAYTAVITNVWGGAVTSAPAMLSVIPPVDTSLVPAVVASAEIGTALNLEYTRDLGPRVNWQPLVEVALGANSNLVYITWPLVDPCLSYRAWQTNGVTQPPLLSMKLVPAIALTGIVGTSVRIDYINQIGPTNAWVTLATVTLANTSQLYFDTSAIGQPPRVYRVAPTP